MSQLSAPARGKYAERKRELILSFRRFRHPHLSPLLRLSLTLLSFVIDPSIIYYGAWRTTIGLFTVAILGPFSAHFQTHFRLIFVYLAEKQTKGNEKWDEK